MTVASAAQQGHGTIIIAAVHFVIIFFQPQPQRLHFAYAAEQMANSILNAGVTDT